MVEFGIGEYYYQARDLIDFLRQCPLGQPIYLQKGYEGQFAPIGNISQTNVAIYLENKYGQLTVRDLYNVIDPPHKVTDELRVFAHELKKGLFDIGGRFIPLHKSDRIVYLKVSDNCYPVEKYELISNGIVFYAAGTSLNYKDAEHFAEEFLKRG